MFLDLDDLGNPQNLRVAAARLREAAAHFEHVGQETARPIDRSAWACRRAEAFRHDMEDRGRHMREFGSHMEELAAALDAEAQRREHELSHRSTIEKLVRSALSSVVQGRSAVPIPPGIDLANLPPTGSGAWLALARRLDIRH